MPGRAGDEHGRNNHLPTIARELVYDQLIKLDVYKSAGPDDLHPRVLKELAEVIVEPLAKLFHTSWRSGEVPEDWKRAKVVPIHKKGRRENPGNYGLISLPSIPGKILEKLVKESIFDKLAEGKILNSQHGFFMGRSCLTNLISFCDQVTRHLDTRYNVNLLYLDFQKAFELVSHDVFMRKLEDCGLNSKTVR
ncbi:protein lin-52 homolog isoform X2 [Alligator mississippiensis]|nr:protein lin-52 homolog isoform X2 [Alligator mississippiensis]